MESRCGDSAFVYQRVRWVAMMMIALKTLGNAAVPLAIALVAQFAG